MGRRRVRQLRAQAAEDLSAESSGLAIVGAESCSSSVPQRLSNSAPKLSALLLLTSSLLWLDSAQAQTSEVSEITDPDDLMFGDCSCCNTATGGGGLILPIVAYEHTWSKGVRGCLYLIALLWCFLGVSVLSDVFMAAIEEITGTTYMKKVYKRDKSGQKIRDSNGQFEFEEKEELVWNASVANLTLMALGSSTPEILLSVIEICGASFYAGDLGPGTVVGSASFNLYMITALCFVALPTGETRKIEGFTVYCITALHSVLAYGWLWLIVTQWTPDVITIEEAAITFLLLPWLVCWVYCADKNWFRSEPVSPDDGETTADAVENGTGTKTSSKLEESSAGGKKANTYLSHRRATISMQTGQGKQNRDFRLASIKEDDPDRDFKLAIQESFMITSHSVYHWEASAYSFPETSGHARIVVIRQGKTTKVGKITYATSDGTAVKGEAYEEKMGILEFNPGETEKPIFIPLIHDYEWRPDLEFYVTLSPADPEGKVDPRSNKTRVTVVDMDKAGTFAWSKISPTNYISTDSAATLIMERRQGGMETSTVRVKTRDGTATAGIHYEALEKTIEWKPYETSKMVKILLISFSEPQNENPEDKAVRFYVDLQEVKNGEGVGESHTADIKIEYNPLANVKDENKEDEAEEEEKLTYAGQFRQALNVNAGGEISEATVMDCIMHWLSIGWKVFAAIVPPAHWGGGWPCFCIALLLIGAITALINDLASIFGCVVGLKDPVTAFTVVALGTSVPDTFASMLAVRSDDSADNAIGNVTGSNSVNVFLGLGFPWLIAAIYWDSVGATQEWKDRYADWLADPKFSQYAEGGAFVVQGGSLGFNTLIFTILTTFAFIFLFVRRVYIGAEIGGPDWANYGSSAVFATLWFIYVIVCAIQVYHPDSMMKV